MKALVTALLLQQFLHCRASDESYRPKNADENPDYFVEAEQYFTDLSARGHERTEYQQFPTFASSSSESFEFAPLSSLTTDDDMIVHDAYYAIRVEILLPQSKPSPAKMVREHLKAGKVDDAIQLLEQTPIEEFGEILFNECITSLINSIGHLSLENRRLVIKYLKGLYADNVWSELIIDEAIQLFEKVAFLDVERCDDCGIRELLELIPMSAWHVKSRDSLITIVCDCFGLLATSNKFSAFSKLFIRHLRSILNHLGKLSAEEHDKILNAFMFDAIESPAPVAHMMLLEMLSDYLNIADHCFEQVVSIKIQSIHGKKYYEKLLCKLMSKSQNKSELYKQEWNNSVNDITAPQVSIMGSTALGDIVQKMQSEYDTHRCLDELYGPSIVSYIQNYLDGIEMGDIAHHFDEIFSIVQGCDIYFSSEAAKNAFAAYYQRSSATDISSQVLLSVVEILGYMFGSLEKNSQMTFLSSLVDLFIATRQPHIVYGLSFMFGNSDLDDAILAQLYCHLFQKTIDGFCDDISMNSLYTITISVLPLIPEAQYRRILLKLANIKIDLTLGEPYFPYSLLLYCLAKRPIFDPDFLKKLKLDRVTNQQKGGDSYNAAVSVFNRAFQLQRPETI